MHGHDSQEIITAASPLTLILIGLLQNTSFAEFREELEPAAAHSTFPGGQKTSNPLW